MERHQGRKGRGYEKKYAQSSILPDKKFSRAEVHLRTGRVLFESRDDNIHFPRVGNKGLTSSCGDIRLIKDDICPRSRLESDKNHFPHSAFRLKAFTYSFEDLSSTQDVDPRTGRGLYKSQNDNIHPSRMGSKWLTSSCGDIRLIEDEISPRNRINSEDHVFFQSGFGPVAFSYSFEDIPSTQGHRTTIFVLQELEVSGCHLRGEISA